MYVNSYCTIFPFLEHYSEAICGEKQIHVWAELIEEAIK